MNIKECIDVLEKFSYVWASSQTKEAWQTLKALVAQTPNSQSLQLQNNIIDALIADIKDRRGLKWEWEKIDADVVREIRTAWLKILQPTGI